jgi:hypothetical protein
MACLYQVAHELDEDRPLWSSKRAPRRDSDAVAGQVTPADITRLAWSFIGQGQRESIAIVTFGGVEGAYIDGGITGTTLLESEPKPMWWQRWQSNILLFYL